jgi:NitT/TauT family transport system permease protein
VTDPSRQGGDAPPLKPRRGAQRLVRRFDRLLSPLVLIVSVLIWHMAVKAFAIPAFILPPPLEVWDALVAGLWTSPFDRSGFTYHAAITISEALLGFVIGSAVGIVLGFLIASSKLIERVVLPYIVGFQSLPKVALAPLLVIWFGFGVEGKVIITSVITFFPLLINSITGYRAVDRDRIDLARSCNATQLQILWKIIVPSALPYIFAGLNIASVLAILGAIVGEFVGAQSGLGMLLMQYNQSMQIAPVFALLLILAVVGYLANASIRWLELKLCFWAQGSGPVTEG